MDETPETERPFVNAAVGSCPLIVIDVIKSCCSEKSERPEIDITFNRKGRMAPRLRQFADEYRTLGDPSVD